MPRIIVFDVNETLLDISALEPLFAAAFGDGRVMREWFSTVLLYSEAVTLADLYSPFAAIADAGLEMVARSRGLSIGPGDRGRILTGMRSLPAHPEVREGLQHLRDAGLRLVALTNSPQQTVEEQFTHAHLAEFFERVFSVDSVRRFKPAPEPYRFVAQALAVETSRLRMVAAHAWDIAGAMQAGCAAAFVMRPGKALFPLAPAPDIIARDLRELATKIIDAESQSNRL